MRGRGEGSIRQKHRKDGSVFYEARAFIDGRQVSFTADSKTGALTKARQARSDWERGTARTPGTVTVEAYMREWLETRVRPAVRARTYTSYRELSETHIFPALGRARLAQLTPGQVSGMLAGVVSSGRSESTARRVRAALSSALRAAMLDHGLPRNVASLARVPKSDRPQFAAEVVTPVQARAILASFAGHRLEPLVLFSVATGVRQGELLALRWCDIDMDARTVTITHAVDVQGGRRLLARPKTDAAQRTLALSDMAVRALELRREQEVGDRILARDAWTDTGLVFPSPTGGIRSGGAVRRTFQRHLAGAGLSVIRWHALRRVFAALLQDRGVPLERIRDLMGHSELRVTEGYAYTLPESLASDMRTIDDALREPELGTE